MAGELLTAERLSRRPFITSDGTVMRPAVVAFHPQREACGKRARFVPAGPQVEPTESRALTALQMALLIPESRCPGHPPLTLKVPTTFPWSTTPSGNVGTLLGSVAGSAKRLERKIARSIFAECAARVVALASPR